MIGNKLIGHRIATGTECSEPPAGAYEYVVAGNGLFIRGERAGLSAVIQQESFYVNGLCDLGPKVQLAPGLIPEELLRQSKGMAEILANVPMEVLFHFTIVDGRWKLEVPEQTRTAASCRPMDAGAGSSYDRAVVELHSHHGMAANFSSMDDDDEKGFRIYGVMGRLGTDSPEIRWRVGIYGNMQEIALSDVVDGDCGFIDCAEVEAEIDALMEFTEVAEFDEDEA